MDFEIAIPMQELMFDSDSGAELHEESIEIIAVAIRAKVKKLFQSLDNPFQET